MVGRLRAGTALVLSGVLAGCAAAHPAPAPSSASTASAAASTAAPAQPVLTGFGALRTDWNRTHAVVGGPGCPPGSAYDEDPRLDAFPGCPGSKYVAVDGPGNRVEAYDVRFPAGTTLQQTLLAVARELPPDAALVWRSTLPGCTVAQYRSAELARLDPANIPGGLIEVASETTPAGRRYLGLLPLDLQGKAHC
jgi:hypothetical protein